MNKFFYFNIPCNYFEDSVMMLTAAANATIDDVFILISHSGITKELIEVTKLAKERQATVIGLTPAQSPLGKQSTIVLSMKTPDDMDVYMPTATRLAQLTLVDILVTGLTLRKGPNFINTIKRSKEVIRATRINLGDKE
jgi:RpiR family carbohydrate utilization transcriptional regulator